MMNCSKYTRQYFMPPKESLDWTKKEYVDHAPIWCSVDLRDGNQALVVPMSLEQKVAFFKLLVRIGFKEIEVGFPAASETEYHFLRTLIEEDLIPDDVTIQVLTQAREHIIRKTFEALEGRKARHRTCIQFHFPSPARAGLRKSREEIIQIAVDGAKLLKRLTEETGGNYRLNTVRRALPVQSRLRPGGLQRGSGCMETHRREEGHHQPPCDRGTSMPHVYASQIEYIART